MWGQHEFLLLLLVETIWQLLFSSVSFILTSNSRSFPFYSSLSILFLSLVPPPPSCRTPVTWCTDLWSCVSSLTGVTWNIRVFTASACMDRSPPHETRDSLTATFMVTPPNQKVHLHRTLLKKKNYFLGVFRARSWSCSGQNATEKLCVE